MLSDERRREIGRFLRTRRARLQPEDVGILRGARRRTPGLRREEVASLAQVSIEWYTWLEQARDVRASPATLRSIAEALRLEPSERAHLLRLAGHPPDAGIGSNGDLRAVGPNLQRLIDQLDCCPSWVLGTRWDYLAWNAAAEVISGDLSRVSGIERNGLHQMFLNPRMRATLVDWEHHARGIVGLLRARYAESVDDPWFRELVDLLLERSRQFAAWWDNHEIKGYQDGEKHYDHPEAGRLSFEYTALNLADERFRELTLITYVPMEGTGTRDRVRRLLGLN